MLPFQDYKRRVDKQRHDYIYYYVSKKHWKTFINCIEEYEKEILNPNKESSNCKECLSLKDKNEKQIDNKINEMYQKYEVNSHFSLDNKASHLEKIALNKLLETKRKINSFLIKEYLCNVHNK
ncbi:hypothetical protein [Spiroplasma endosymbiont of Melieria omissa]|uniref:hypothetical protein n=1 Tax=Spiroplasma endosymbiont of Melieria omissa TaxID=3139324 RepID=UPI003CCADF3A